MALTSKHRLGILPFLPALLLVPLNDAGAQQDPVAALKQSLAANQKRLAQYRWTETTLISMKGDEKSRIQKQCFYGADGKVQKQQISAPPPPQQPSGGRLKQKVVAKKKEEISDYMKQAVALVHAYVPPDAQRIQAARDGGKLSMSPGPGTARLDFRDFLKPGDAFSLTIDNQNSALRKITVKSYLDSPKDAVSLDVTFALLEGGTSYPANIVLLAPEKDMQVVVQNGGYQMVAPASQPPPPPQPQSRTEASQEPPQQGLPPDLIDSLTAPIALYPDALIAQMLTASTNFAELQSFARWLGQNTSLTGSALQDAAQQNGFDTCYVALAPFPQVVQSLMEKPDWTQQLGLAFTTDQDAVFDSIQRLRTKAQAVGNLKTTPQQEVETQTTSTGQQVIVIQPANPQVVYVPTYDPQVVYVQPAPPPSAAPVAGAAMIGFTTGVIIGASSAHYYPGPYAWHGAAMYNEAWQARANYVNQRQNVYQQNASQRQSAAQTNQSQRQSASQANQAQRQSTSQANQAQRQSGFDAAQGNRQPQQASRQNAASTSSLGGQRASERTGMSSGGFSGYQNGGAARAQSSRGSSSLASSRGSGRRR